MAPDNLDSLGKDDLKQLVLELIEQNRVLMARIAELEAKLGQPPKTPDNSSLPPSHGQKASRAERRKLQRQGRPGVTRDLCPEPDKIRDIFTERCTGCGGDAVTADQSLIRAYDHIDLPPIKPITTRINLHGGACPCCRARVTATPPADMPAGTPFGPGIVALVIYLHTPDDQLRPPCRSPARHL